MNKTTEFEHLIFLYNPDFATVTETWQRQDIALNEIIPPSHKITREDRRTRGGEVAIVYKKDTEL